MDVKEQVFRVTVVGEFSSGKSTFLNALIGRDLLPHAVSETTATITYIHNVPAEDSRNNKAVIHFNDEMRADETIDVVKDKKKFQDYLSALNEEGVNVVKVVKSVDVYASFANITDPIVIVDTPGMNGTADGHRDITMREIGRSHASICLFHLKGVGKTDLDFMKQLMAYQDTFFFVLNQIDDLKSTEGETPEKRIASFADEIKDKVYGGGRTPERVYGISALNALASRDRGIEYLYEEDRRQGNTLTDQDREKCWSRSRFETLEKDLFAYLSSNAKDAQFYESILQKIDSLLTDEIERGERKKKLYEIDINANPELQLIEEEWGRIKESVEKNKQKLKRELGSEMGDLEKRLRDELREDCKRNLERVNGEVGRISTLEELDVYNKNVSAQAMTFHASKANELVEDINEECDEIFADLVASVNKLVPRLSFSEKSVRSNVSISFEVTGNFETNDEIEQLKRRSVSLNEERRLNSADKSQNERDLAQAQRRVYDFEEEKQRRREAEQAKYKTRTEKVCTGSHEERRKKEGIGNSLARFFTFGHCGYETVKVNDYKYVTRDNQGEINARKRQIDAEYNRKIERTQDEIDQFKQLIGQSEKMDRELARRIEENNRKIEEARRELEYMKANAKSSLLKENKRRLIEQVEQWYGHVGEIYSDLAEGIRSNIEKCRAAMEKEMFKFYDVRLKDYEDEMNVLLDNLKNGGDNRSKSEEIRVADRDIEAAKVCVAELNKIKKLIA